MAGNTAVSGGSGELWQIMQKCKSVHFSAFWRSSFPECFTRVSPNVPMMGKPLKIIFKMIKIALTWDHHKRTPAGEEGPVEVRVTINRNPYYINTGVRVREDRLVGNTIRDD